MCYFVDAVLVFIVIKIKGQRHIPGNSGWLPTYTNKLVFCAQTLYNPAMQQNIFDSLAEYDEQVRFDDTDAERFALRSDFVVHFIPVISAGLACAILCGCCGNICGLVGSQPEMCCNPVGCCGCCDACDELTGGSCYEDCCESCCCCCCDDCCYDIRLNCGNAGIC